MALHSSRPSQLFPVGMSDTDRELAYAMLLARFHARDATMYWQRTMRNSTGASRKRKSNMLQVSRNAKRKHRR